MNNILVVDIKLKNKLGNINECMIYEKGKELPIQDADKLFSALNIWDEFIHVQNEYISGDIHPSNIEKYNIRLIQREI